jgi:hypothetical protein
MENIVRILSINGTYEIVVQRLPAVNWHQGVPRAAFTGGLPFHLNPGNLRSLPGRGRLQHVTGPSVSKGRIHCCFILHINSVIVFPL